MRSRLRFRLRPRQRLDTKTKFSPRYEVTAYVHENSLWVVAGNSWPLVNDVWKLTRSLGWGENALRKAPMAGLTASSFRIDLSTTVKKQMPISNARIPTNTH
jgi:hypothetical protein